MVKFNAYINKMRSVICISNANYYNMLMHDCFKRVYIFILVNIVCTYHYVFSNRLWSNFSPKIVGNFN